LVRAALLAAILLAVGKGTTGPLFAQQPADTGEKPAGKPAGDDTIAGKGQPAEEGKPPADQPDQGEEASNSDAELLESLDPNQRDMLAQRIDRMERIISGMREAHERLAQAKTGAETRQLQERVIEDLRKLLEQLKQRQNAQQSQSQSQSQKDQKNQQQNSSQNRRRRGSKSQPDPQNASRSNSQPEQAGQEQRGSDQARGAEERTDAARLLAEEAARRELMVKDIWGHLPPQLREAMRNAYNEKYLPKYEELVKKYYESLAERNRKKRP
jgi:hypothetical protein